MIEIRHPELQAGQTVREAYEELYRERTLLMRDSFYLWLLELMAPVPGRRLADIACGNGRLVELAVAQGIDATGFDVSYAGIASAAAAAPEADWIVGDGHVIPFPNESFDYVASIGSLEHYDAPLQGAAELARILKPNGLACILLPNAYSLLGHVWTVWRTGEVFDDGQPLQRIATLNTWSALLRNAGLMVEYTVPFSEFNRPRTPADLIWTLVRPQKLVRAAMAAGVPTPLAQHFVFLCRRVGADSRPPATPYPMHPRE